MEALQDHINYTDAAKALASGFSKVAASPIVNNVKTIASDAMSSFGAQTGEYLDHAFNNLPLPIIPAQEITEYWRNNMSEQGRDLHDNSAIYREATDPINLLAGLGKGAKFAGMVASPVAELATGAIKSYGKVMDANVAARSAAKRAFMP